MRPRDRVYKKPFPNREKNRGKNRLKSLKISKEFKRPKVKDSGICKK